MDTYLLFMDTSCFIYGHTVLVIDTYFEVWIPIWNVVNIFHMLCVYKSVCIHANRRHGQQMACKAIGSSSWAQHTPAKPSQAKTGSKSLEFYREQGTLNSTLQKRLFSCNCFVNNVGCSFL